MSDYKSYTRTIEIDARRLDEDETVVTAGGPVPAVKGSYAVRAEDGSVSVVTAEDFEDGGYKPSGGSAPVSSSSKPQKGSQPA